MASPLPLLLALAATDPAPSPVASHRDALWQIVHDQCLAQYRDHSLYAPCSLVDTAGRFVVFKESLGPYQYLLIPSDPVSGIEDPQLLAENAPNYLHQAWGARGFLVEILQRRVRETDIVLAINPRAARTQDQLHIHISCLKPAIREQLDAVALGTAWAPAFGPYWARTLSLAQLEQGNPFRLVEQWVKTQRSEMASASVALLSRRPGEVVVLAAVGSADRPIAAEALQDHLCSVLGT